MGRVSLGMPGPWATDNREAADHYTTKIGGVPDWPTLDVNPELLKCSLCGGRLCLVLQVYAPVSSSDLKVEERTIYVLGCPKPKCGNSSDGWRTLRIQKCGRGTQPNTSSQEETRPAESSNSTKTSSNWWVADLWAEGSGEQGDEKDNDVDLQELSRALSEAVSLSSKKQIHSSRSEVAERNLQIKPRVVDSSMPVVPCFYIYFQEERSSGDITDASTQYTSLPIKQNQNLFADLSDEETWEAEKYEYDRALGADRTYLKFKKRMDACPEQCLRYSYGGKPLVAATNLGECSTCRLCGALRHHEMQLMPPLLYFLHQAADSSSTCLPEDWNWLTLIIYTCSKSCFHPSCEEKFGGSCWTVAEEAIIIQCE